MKFTPRYVMRIVQNAAIDATATPNGRICSSKRAWRIAMYARNAMRDQTSFGSQPQ